MGVTIPTHITPPSFWSGLGAYNWLFVQTERGGKNLPRPSLMSLWCPMIPQTVWTRIIHHLWWSPLGTPTKESIPDSCVSKGGFYPASEWFTKIDGCAQPFFSTFFSTECLFFLFLYIPASPFLPATCHLPDTYLLPTYHLPSAASSLTLLT